MDIKLKYKAWIGEKHADMAHKLIGNDIETFAFEFVEHLVKKCSIPPVSDCFLLQNERERIWNELLVEENETAFARKIEAYTDDVYNVIFKNGTIIP